MKTKGNIWIIIGTMRKNRQQYIWERKILMCVTFIPGGIAFAVSTVALVFTCLQNKYFQEHNWQSFRHYAKLSAVLLWIDLGLLRSLDYE